MPQKRPTSLPAPAVLPVFFRPGLFKANFADDFNPLAVQRRGYVGMK